MPCYSSILSFIYSINCYQTLLCVRLWVCSKHSRWIGWDFCLQGAHSLMGEIKLCTNWFENTQWWYDKGAYREEAIFLSFQVNKRFGGGGTGGLRWYFSWRGPHVKWHRIVNRYKKISIISIAWTPKSFELSNNSASVWTMFGFYIQSHSVRLGGLLIWGRVCEWREKTQVRD